MSQEEYLEELINQRNRAWNLIIKLVPVYEAYELRSEKMMEEIKNVLLQRAATIEPSVLKGNAEIKLKDVGKVFR